MRPNNDFLRDYVKDTREEMAWRRDLELRLVQLLLIFYPILATAMVTLYQTTISRRVYWILAGGAIIFILLALLFVTDRIRHEHKAYAILGTAIVKVWTYFGLFDAGVYLKEEAILPEELRDPKNGLGKGKGYRRTLILIWIIAVAIITMILALAWLKP